MQAPTPNDHPVSRCLPPHNQLQELATRLYPEMRKIARLYSRKFGARETLRPTALVSEVFLKLRADSAWADEGHFLACVAIAARHILVNDARMRLADKRSGALSPAELDDDVFWQDDQQVVDLHDALLGLEKLDPRLSEVVEYRFFGGYSEQEVATLMGVSEKTIRRDWVKARAMLNQQLASAL
jgi:RNA polymerase sigma factor (TIGR02999 family)